MFLLQSQDLFFSFQRDPSDSSLLCPAMHKRIDMNYQESKFLCIVRLFLYSGFPSVHNTKSYPWHFREGQQKQ